MGGTGKRWQAGKAKLDRVMIELVTPYNWERHREVMHVIMTDPARYGQFGSWSHFPTEAPKDDWIESKFIAIVGEKAIGFGLITRERGLGDVATLQLGLRPEWRGKGYGATLGRLLTRYAFENLGMEKIEGSAFGSNPASVAMQAGGMTAEGVQRRHCKVRGQYVDRHLFGLTREEWLAQVAK